MLSGIISFQTIFSFSSATFYPEVVYFISWPKARFISFVKDFKEILLRKNVIIKHTFLKCFWFLTYQG